MRWQILSKTPPDIIKQLLLNRGLKTRQQQEEFLNPQNPYRLTAKQVGVVASQLAKALARIKQAIKGKEKIIVYGDYDTDGVCATALLWEAIFQLGGDVLPFIPNREEGYGLKVERVEQLARDGVGLIVTVDQGIVQYAQVDRARQLGVDVIVTDHHTLGQKKPRAVALVHTTKLAGSGVAWFLARALLIAAAKKPPAGSWGLDLVTIGTVADMVSLLGPNRSLVKFGLPQLAKTKRPGLRTLFAAAGLAERPIDVFAVGFLIGPRLNASGRMADPMDALRLVCTKNEAQASELAQKINVSNQSRQALTQKTMVQARELWLAQGQQKELIFISHTSFEHGVIGLVASKLKDEFYRPAVVLAPRQDHWVASARSIQEFDMIAAVRQCADILGPHGGHPLAAGFSVATDKLEALKQRLLQTAADQLKDKKLAPRLTIDAQIKLADVNLPLYDQLEQLAPFGQDNPQPLFVTRQVQVVNARRVGHDQSHLKLQFRQGDSFFEAIGFGLSDRYEQLALADSGERLVDIAYQVDLNQWNGHQSLQLKIKDLKLPK